MTTRYVGIGGSDGNTGLSWAQRKLTLNGVEDTPVAAGDTIYVGPGTYREMLTCDVSGTAGNQISYIGDYLGTNTDGVGGIVRITGSDNDQTFTRNNCISNTNPRNYRTFKGFVFDGTAQTLANHSNGGNTLQFYDCIFGPMIANGSYYCMTINGAAITNLTVQNCVFWGNRTISSLLNIAYSGAQTDNSNNLVQNCLFFGGGGQQVRIDRMGGTTVKNCGFFFLGPLGATNASVYVATTFTGGQTVTVNNCLFYGNSAALSGQSTGDITENYNTFSSNYTDRTNTNTGANSVTYPVYLDTRWFFELLYRGAGPNSIQVISPFDLASYCALLNVAGTSPPTLDMRGTAVQGSQREWGPLEYDSTLQINAGPTNAEIAAAVWAYGNRSLT
jgi:hypothetical protein